MSDELYRLSAVETCERLRAGDFSPLELVEVAAARIATVDGLPIGLQIVGPPHGEDRVLAAAVLLEEIQGGPATPIDPRPPGT